MVFFPGQDIAHRCAFCFGLGQVKRQPGGRSDQAGEPEQEIRRQVEAFAAVEVGGVGGGVFVEVLVVFVGQSGHHDGGGQRGSGQPHSDPGHGSALGAVWQPGELDRDKGPQRQPFFLTALTHGFCYRADPVAS